MKKIGIILDSFSCKEKSELDKLGFGFIPLQVIIDGTTYSTGDDMASMNLLDKITNTADVKTSMPRLDIIEEVIDKFCAENDEVVYLGISSALSSTFSVVTTYGNKYPNFRSIDNNLTGSQYVETAQYIKREYEKTGDLDKIVETVLEHQKKVRAYIIPNTLKRLIGGGRLKGAKKFILQALKLTPIILYSHLGKLDSHGVARSVTLAVKKSLKDAFESYDPKTQSLGIVVGNNYPLIESTKEILKNANITEYTTDVTSTLIAAHCGSDAIAVIFMPKLLKD